MKKQNQCVHSGTEYIGGHSDICCGAVLTSRKLAEPMKMTAMDLGGSLNATTCAQVERSLKTLHLRVSTQSENAPTIANRLSEHDKIEQLFYPGLPSHPAHKIASRQMSGIGGIESTICASAETSHKKMSKEARKRIGGAEWLMRLSVGIEHVDDLLNDLIQALDG